MGFSRQEFWSGLPFPSPGDLPNSGIELISPPSPALAGKLPLSHLIIHNNLQATVLCSVTQLCPILCYPMDCSPPGSSVHGDSSGKNVGMGCHALPPRDLPNPGIKYRSPALQEDSLPSEPLGKPLQSRSHLRNQRANCQHLLDHGESKRIPEKHLFLLH